MYKECDREKKKSKIQIISKTRLTPQFSYYSLTQDSHLFKEMWWQTRLLIETESKVILTISSVLMSSEGKKTLSILIIGLCVKSRCSLRLSCHLSYYIHPKFMLRLFWLLHETHLSLVSPHFRLVPPAQSSGRWWAPSHTSSNTVPLSLIIMCSRNNRGLESSETWGIL